jgi:hypothetical protein
LSWIVLNSWLRRGRSGDRTFHSHCGNGKTRTGLFAAALFGLAILIAGLASVDKTAAQTPSVGILAPGNAIVTGFSGAPPPAQIAPGQDPGDLTFIDLNGPSASIFNLQAPGAPPQAQVLGEANPFTVTAAQIGQVFGVALDNATPPNMYVAASSAYGLPIVVPGPSGAPVRLHQGAPGASFMAGLFGPAAQNGGPGSIWRIDGGSGAVSLFANVTLNGAANTGPALGGLAFDAASNSLFAADRQTGMIHRFNLSGTEIGRYDHGVQGLAAAGQPQIPYTPNPLAITNPLFSSDNPATWDYAAAGRRVFGVAAYAGRLYYAVAQNLQIWSVSIASNGSFGSDARMEVQVPPAPGATEISKIAFDGNGAMVLAERAAPTGDYELMAVAQAGIGRVLRYAPVPGPPGAWQPVPDQYAIGFPGQLTNANGGVAIGYGYDANGNLDRTSCSGFVWSTGEQMRNAVDPNLAALLAANGTLYLNGMQGNAAELVEPANVPPLLTYFVDYDAQLDDPAARGHMGDIAIPRNCGQSAGFLFPPPPWLPSGWYTPPSIPPALYCPASQMTPSGQCCPAWQQVVNGACSCPGGLPPGPNGQCACSAGSSSQPGVQCCPPGTIGSQCRPICPNGATDPVSIGVCGLGFAPVLNSSGQYGTCLNGSPANPPFSLNPPSSQLPLGCIGASPYGNAANCPQGWALAPFANSGVSVCQPTPQEVQCLQQTQGTDTFFNGTCQQLCPPGDTAFPTIQCCPNGETPGPSGICCPAGGVPNPYTGACCPPGSQVNPATGACLKIVLNCPPDRQTVTGQCCPVGETPQPDGSCLPPPNNCQPGTTHYCSPQSGAVLCKLGDSVPSGCCPGGSSPDHGYCVTTGSTCGPGSQMVCCPPGQTPIVSPSTGQLTGACGPPPPPPGTGNTCAPGYPPLPGGGCCLEGLATTSGTCQPIRIIVRGCPIGAVFNLRNGTCDPQSCPPGLTRRVGVCACPVGEKFNASGQCVAACSDGGVLNPFNGKCERQTTTTPPPPPAPTQSCAPGYVLGTNNMCERVTTVCPPGEVPGANGVCVTAPPLGTVVPVLPPGTINPPAGVLVPLLPGTNVPGVPATGPGGCPADEIMGPRGCEKRSTTCPTGETMGANGCQKSVTQPVTCPPGEEPTPRGCEKVPPPPPKINLTPPKITAPPPPPKKTVIQPKLNIVKPPPTVKLPPAPVQKEKR